MRAETIKFENPFTGEQVEKTFYFHLTKADLLRILGRSNDEDWEAYVKSMLQTGSNDDVMDFIESIIRDAVGERTPDGRFEKSKAISNSFIGSDAYGELFVRLITEDGFADKFFNGLIGNVDGKPTKQGLQLQGNRQQRRNKKHNNQKQNK